MCLNKANSMEYVEVRVFRPVGSIPAFRLMVFAASTVFGVKVAVASPDAAGVESPEAVDSVDSALLSGAVAAAPCECGNNQRRRQNQS